SDNYPKEVICDYLQKITPLLYLKAALIPVIQPANPEITQRFVTQEEWEGLFNTLRQKFGNQDEFWYIDPETMDYDNPEKGSLSEHYTDIYQDMKDFLLLYQQDSIIAKENAIRELHKSYENRLGYRLVNALRAIHNIVVTPTSDIEYNL
ncbi:MAG: DUF5063 domain-containing protein, partial [Bacteroidales bacterium]|nr:DUF5063 domain-containing protein [Bacteroidales bacterium]